ncbi:glycosyltransferase family 39 protein [Aldersonia sp. NBC_00410]|uniref:glycosyltransferase family 39 protein n=1 Tax=Aldersonia sp. NBC_00410 TaxID=2975954 RepID=UPI00225768A6|nr:glycosyltransferase family 39 protein [Aldersonia sp. NBC_00410]MCX5042043.1 glycosyltransferase family 39 protein [Aldersonia sp. NBC_00410]
MTARHPRRTIFWTTFAGYALVGVVLSVGHGILMGDALSRVQAAQSVLFSRDPHVAAIGFVFSPLTAIAELPAVALSPWIPALTRYGVAGVLMSALFMGGAAVQIWGIAGDRGVPRWLCVAATALFALHPMIVIYGANGMSEAPFLFCVCWAVRRGIRWTHTDDVHDLVALGSALGLAYLVRYDAALVIFVAAVFVALRSAVRTRPFDWYRGGVDLTIVALPGALAFVVWAAAGWLLTGDAFAQFSSSYGNSAILEQSQYVAQSIPASLAFSAVEVLVLAPALPLLAPLATVLAVQRRDLEVVVAPLILGTVLAFQTLSYARGLTFGFLRFYICAIPLLVILVIQLYPARGQAVSPRPGRFANTRLGSGPQSPLAGVAAAAVVLLGFPITVVGLAVPSLSVQQYSLAALFADDDDTSQRIADARRINASFSTERRLNDYLDQLDLPRGSVLMDTVYGFAVAAASADPDRYVVPSDQDFVTILDDPAANGVKYILAVPNTDRGTSDAVNLRYPTIYDNGSDVAALELEIPNDGADLPTWRLYRVTT